MSFTSSISGNWNSGATWGNAGDDVAGSGYPDASDATTILSGDVVTLTQDEEAGYLVINSGGEIRGGGYKVTLNDAGGATYIFSSVGTIGATASHGSFNIDITGGSADRPINEAGTGSITNLLINNSGRTYKTHYHLSLLGNLTITAGTLTTNNGSADQNLTVEGDVLIGAGSGTGDSAVLDGNASEIIINGGMKIDVTGKYDATTHANGTVINKYLAGGGIYALQLIAGGTFIHNDGLVHVTGTGGYSLVIEGFSGSDVSGTDANALHDLKVTLNSISNFVKLDPVPSSNGDTMVITGDLDIVEGKVHGNSTSDILTVNGDVTVRDGAQLSESTSVTGAMTFGSLTIENGGTYIATSGNTTLTNEATYWCLDVAQGGTFTHNDGLVTVTRDSNTLIKGMEGDVASGTGANRLNNLTVNLGSVGDRLEMDHLGASEPSIIGGNVIVTKGKFYPRSTDDDANAFTILGSLTVQAAGTYGVASRTGADTFGSITTGQVVTAGSFVATAQYTIASVGNTDFTAIGASSNTVGVTFTATGVGSGTGTATGGIYIATSGTTTINGGGSCLDFTAGTLTHNNGLFKISGGNGTQIQTKGATANDNFYDLEIDSSESAAASTSWLGDGTVIENNLTLTEGRFTANTSSHDFTVKGNTSIKADATFGNMGGTQPTGDYTFGGVVTNLGGFFLSTGANNFNGGIRQLASVGTSNGTFNGDAETITIGGTGGILEGNLDDAIVNVNLDAALDFNGDGGTDDYVTLTEGSGAPTIAADGAFTISAWIKPAFTSGSKYVAGEGHSGGSSTDTDRFGIIVNSSTIAISMYINNGDDVSSYVTVDVDKWNHIAFTRAASSTTGRYYINGVAAGTDTVDNANWVLGKIGGYGNNSSNRWQGHIADVKLYNSDLSTDGADLTPIQALASKINIHYSQVGTGTQPLSWFKLNDGTGNPADSGSSGNATVRTNATWDLGGPTDDPFSVNVQDTMTTDGTFTVTQGKLEGKALSSLTLDGTGDYVNTSWEFDTEMSKAFTWSGWFKPTDGQPAAQEYLMGLEKDSNNNWDIALETDGQLKANYKAGGTAVSSTTVTALANGQEKWHHFVWVISTTSNDLYLNGVLETSTSHSITLSNFVNSDQELWFGDRNHSSSNPFTGNLRDLRLYGHALSADQAASLYSGSYNVTPTNMWKMDEGTGQNPNDTGTATARNGTGAGNADLVSGNGTLNLDSTLTIQANGTLSAPRGNLDLEADFDNYGTFTHNSGLVEFDKTSGTQSINNLGEVEPTFYKLNESKTGDTVIVRKSITVIKELNHGTRYFQFDGGHSDATCDTNSNTTIGCDSNSSIKVGQHVWGPGIPDNTKVATVNSAGSVTSFTITNAATATADPVTLYFGVIVTLGDDNDACTVENQNRCLATLSGTGVKFYGGNQLKPFVTSSEGPNHACSLVHLKWGDVSAAAFTTQHNITLDGDMKFGAVTVSSGDTLDLNGQRAEFSGDLNNGHIIDWDGMAVCHGAINYDYLSGANNNANRDLGTIIMRNTASKNITPVTGTLGGFHLLGTHPVALQSATDWGTTPVTVGSTTSTDLGNNLTCGNLTIPTAGVLNAGARTFTVAGDFTTSGGLLGASCLELNGSDEYAATAVFNDDRSVNNSADYTIELWFRRTETSGNETLFDFAHWDSSGSVYTGQSRTSAYMDAAGIIYWDTRTGGGTVNARPQSSAGFDDSKWHHAAFVFKGVSGAHAGTYSTGAKEIWIDGKLEARVLGGDTTTDAGSSVAGNMGYDQNKTMAFQVGRQVVSSIGNFFTGQIDEVRIWSDARTQAEIRDNMFTEVAATADHLRHQWSFNEGTGTTNAALDTATDAEGEAHVAAPITPSAAGAWAGTGTFDEGSDSTLVMAKSGTQNIYYKHVEAVNNLTINDGSTTQLWNTEAAGNGLLDIEGNLTVNEKLKSHADKAQSRIRFTTAGTTIAVGSDVKTTALSELYSMELEHSGSTNIPELTTPRLFLDSTATAVATGDLTITEELQPEDGTTFNANGNTINCLILDMQANSTVDLRNSTLKSLSGSGRTFQLSTGNLLTGNTLIQGFSSNKQVSLYSQPDGNHEVVGTLKYCKMMLHGDITVIGPVIDCTFESGETRGNIRQWHHTLDTQQLLDADEAGDDDLRLTKPALDNALELMTK